MKRNSETKTALNSECIIQWNQLKQENASSEGLDLKTLQRSIEDYRQKSTEIDEQDVRITIRRIRNVAKHKDSENLNVRKSARKVLKSVRHPFQNTINCANRFDKEFRKSKESVGNSQNARVVTQTTIFQTSHSKKFKFSLFASSWKLENILITASKNAKLRKNT